MKINLKKLAFMVFLLNIIPMIVLGQITTKKVTFPTGKSSIAINEVIKGDQTIDYTVSAKEGQELRVSMKSNINACYFNILPPGSEDVAVFSGQMDGNNCAINIKERGIYKIRVYQMRSSARRGTKVNFNLNISITGG